MLITLIIIFRARKDPPWFTARDSQSCNQLPETSFLANAKERGGNRTGEEGRAAKRAGVPRCEREAGHGATRSHASTSARSHRAARPGRPPRRSRSRRSRRGGRLVWKSLSLSAMQQRTSTFPSPPRSPHPAFLFILLLSLLTTGLWASTASFGISRRAAKRHWGHPSPQPGLPPHPRSVLPAHLLGCPPRAPMAAGKGGWRRHPNARRQLRRDTARFTDAMPPGRGGSCSAGVLCWARGTLGSSRFSPFSHSQRSGGGAPGCQQAHSPGRKSPLARRSSRVATERVLPSAGRASPRPGSGGCLHIILRGFQKRRVKHNNSVRISSSPPKRYRAVSTP